MKYRYEIKVTPFDFFKLSMHRTYHSMVGVCNIIFTVAIILLTVKFWGKINDVLEALLFIGCLLFTVLQPIAVYVKAKAQVAGIPRGLILGVDDHGIHITVGGKKQDISFKKVKSIIKEYKMLIIFSDASHGYILTDKVLGKEKEEFYQYVKLKIEQKK